MVEHAALLAISILILEVFFISYRWIRGALGDPEPDAIPSARIAAEARQRGFRREPGWLRPLQATILAIGLTGTIVTAVTFVGVAGFMYLV